MKVNRQRFETACLGVLTAIWDDFFTYRSKPVDMKLRMISAVNAEVHHAVFFSYMYGNCTAIYNLFSFARRVERLMPRIVALRV